MKKPTNKPAKKPTLYNHKKIETKWQKYWSAKKMYQASDSSTAEKFYTLVEFPYPSGAGLHTGHIRSYTALDILSRKKRAEGYNVLYPIGWDAFGLPAENYAIKTGVHPKITTKKNTDTFRRQLKSIGLSFDWSREINTTDPEYYKWTQWFFLKFYKAGLAYKAITTVNWCPSCLVGLANEEVVNGECERCGTKVEKRDKDQWMLAITKYAERLDKDLDDVDYLEKIKIQQRNWIGKSVDTEVDFNVANSGHKIKIVTTRVDTIFGATFLVLAPEHPLMNELKDKISNKEEVFGYIKNAKEKTEFERGNIAKEKTGVKLIGVEAINPLTKEYIPVFVADYVLWGYGTGAIMAVPAHDERDFAFAKKFDAEILHVIEDPKNPNDYVGVYEGDGKHINSGFLNGLDTAGAIQKMNEYVVKNGFGRPSTHFRLRDWVFSRQRYWGEPIPLIHCVEHGWVPVPDKDLPVKLPEVKKYVPSTTGESPLASISSWVNTKCPTCGGPAKRETDTMPQWAGSSWYFLRYLDPKNKKQFADPKKVSDWMPVNWYNGGMEHTTLHLLYSRFWYKFFFDQKLVPTSEPYAKRTSHGLILAEGGAKMSKSKGNSVGPDELIKIWGADTLRIYEMFMGPFDQPVAWNTEGMIGPRRFIERVWNLASRITSDKKTLSEDYKSLVSDLQKTISKVSDDIERLSFNTAVSSLMTLLNRFEKETSVLKKEYADFILLVAPFAPHVTEEIWANLGNKKSIHLEKWQTADKTLLIEDKVMIAVQVNGKLRATIEATSLEEADVVLQAKSDTNVSKYLAEGELIKTIYVRGKVVNFVIKPFA